MPLFNILPILFLATVQDNDPPGLIKSSLRFKRHIYTLTGIFISFKPIFIPNQV